MQIKKNLFIVASPLQLLNAIEAQHYFKTSHNILILLYNSFLNNTDFNQKKSLLIQDNWDEVIYYDLGKIAKQQRFFKQVLLVKQLKKNSYDYVFSGDFGTIQQVIMANIDVGNIYLLDDGTESISIYDRIKDKYFFNKTPFIKKMKLYRYVLMNLKFKIQQDINFFTIYHLESLPHIHILQHDFSYLKQTKLKECKKDSTIYLLGQNIVENGVIREEVYLKYLQKIIDQFEGNIIYKPHRSEKITDAYHQLISENFSIDKDISQGPIETSLINHHIYPAVIISFFSSALFSLDKIFDDTLIYAVKIHTNDLIEIDNNIINDIDSCYNFFENTGVKSIDIF